jgi:integrase
MARELTDRFLKGKAVLPKAGKPQIDHWDNKQPRGVRLGIRVTASGRSSFVLWYRWRGKARRDTLRPEYPHLSLADARNEARQTYDDLRGDPKRDPKKSDRKPRAHYLPESIETDNGVKKGRAETWEEAIEQFINGEKLAARQVSAKSARNDRHRLRKHLEPWLSEKISEETPNDLDDILEHIRDIQKKQFEANRVFQILTQFFNWCAHKSRKYVEVSPMLDVEKPLREEPKRTRDDGTAPIFSDSEIAAVWKAADALPNLHGGAVIKLALLTGKRIGAVAEMRWREIEDDFWTPPQLVNGKPRKNKKRFPIPLSKLAMRIIDKFPKVEGNEYVFPGNNAGTHITTGTWLRKAIKQGSEIDDFNIHSIKHTVVTRLGKKPVSAPYEVACRITDHTLPGVHASYMHHDYADEMGPVLEAWSEHLQDILRREGVWQENIEPIRG